MRRLRSLRGMVPFAALSAAIVVVSVVAVGRTVWTGATGPADAPVRPGVAPTSTGPGLSGSDRLAYWREAADSEQLWASDLDGGRRRVVASEPRRVAVALTRWSPDGSTIAYAVGGTRLALAPLAGATVRLALPTTIGPGQWAIVAIAWSPDSSRLAVTLRDGGGAGNARRLLVVAARYGATWDPVAAAPDDAVAAAWLDADQLVVERATEVLGVVDLRTETLRPLTGMPAVSPLVAGDGRIWFAGGRASGDGVSTLQWASGWVWSMGPDGDVRRMAPRPNAFPQPMRLAGVLADGRAVVLVPSGGFVIGDAAAAISSPGATILRAAVTSDGRRIVAATSSRILLVDPGAATSDGRPIPATVLLSDVGDGDLWSAHPGVPLSAAGAPAAAVGGRLAFVLGGAAWSWSPPAAPVELASGVVGAGPVWSPRGDRLALTTAAGEGRAIPAVMRADGAGRIDLDTSGIGALTFVAYGPGALSWTPAGDVAVQLGRGDRALQFVTRAYDAATGSVRETVDGRATWIGGRRVVLTDGVLDNDTGNRVEQSVVVRDAGTERALTDARRLGDDRLLAGLPDREQAPAIADVQATGDPDLLALWFQRQRFGGYLSAALVVVRLADGSVVWDRPFSPRDPLRDVAFAPQGPYVGFSAGGAGQDAATVVDVSRGVEVRTLSGRFAGWSADARTFYVARDEGLFSYPVADGDARYVGPFGVRVVAAP